MEHLPPVVAQEVDHHMSKKLADITHENNKSVSKLLEDNNNDHAVVDTSIWKPMDSFQSTFSSRDYEKYNEIFFSHSISEI